MMPTLFTGNGRRVVRHVGDLPDLALGEEDVALRRRLRAGHQFDEQLALGLQPLVEGLVHRRLDAADVVFGREEAAEFAGVGLAEIGEDLRMAARGLHLLVDVAHLLQRPVLGDDLLREGDGAGAQLAFRHDLVDQAHLQARLARHVLARRHHLQRLLRPHDARQPLRAAGAGQQAEIDFRQAAAGGGHGHAVVTGERHFQAAAQRRAVDRGDHGLGRILDRVLHVEQARALRRLAEFGDVGAGDEGAAFADEHDRFRVRVGDGLFEAARQSVAHGRRERVHRRRIQGEDGDLAVIGEVGHGVDGSHFVSSLL